MNAENQKQSPQYTRTHKAICSALVNLLKTNSFERITVQNILDETPVTRTTFYKHFHDIYEVAECLQQQYFDSQKELISQLENVSLSRYQSLLSNYAQNHRDLLKALYKIKTETVSIREIDSLYHRNNFARRTNMSPDSLPATLYAEVMTGIAQYTIEHDYMHVDARTMYNEGVIESFLALLSLEHNDKLRTELYRLVNMEKVDRD